MNTVSKHLQRYPYARTETLVWLEKRDAKLAQLRQELSPRKPSWFWTFIGALAAAIRRVI